MATIYNQPGNEYGDKLVYEVLGKMPTESIIYAQPLLVYKGERREPDYVIVDKNWGVVVLEVKDWVKVSAKDSRNALVWRSSRGVYEEEHSPVDQAQKATYVLVNRLKEDVNLRNYGGKLDFCYRYAAILPHLTYSTITQLGKFWGESFLMGKEDLTPERILQKIANINVPWRPDPMTESQIRAVCAIIDPQNCIVDQNTGEFKGVYDRVQEEISKEPLKTVELKEVETESQGTFLRDEVLPEKRLEQIASELPSEAANLPTDTNVKLLRGFAGTGKTDVLILRANYLSKIYPEINILVTTFNDPLFTNRLKPELEHIERIDLIKFDTLCSKVFKNRNEGKWEKPQDTHGVIARIAKTNPQIGEFGIDFITDEIIWMKEVGRTSRQDYIELPREGRGGQSGKILSRKQKNVLFDLFEIYQQELLEIPLQDWMDMHNKVRRYLKDGIKPDKYYDVIMIDEAQHFAPVWIQIIQYFLKPGGSLFLCDDPSQSVYRFYSWKQKGIDITGRGKTRWLHVPYRNTRQIFEAAFSLIQNDDFAMKLLSESGGYLAPNLDMMRNGPKPEIHSFTDIQSELDFIKHEIKILIERGVRPQDIGIIHTQKYVLDKIRPHVPSTVQIYESLRQTGMEYSALFLPQTQKLFDRMIGMGWEEDQSRQNLATYMMMTRAKSNLYILYQQKKPRFLEIIRDLAEYHEHK